MKVKGSKFQSANTFINLEEPAAVLEFVALFTGKPRIIFILFIKYEYH
jgi:hypothetical protein